MISRYGYVFKKYERSGAQVLLPLAIKSNTAEALRLIPPKDYKMGCDMRAYHKSL